MPNPGPKALKSNKPEPNELQRAGEGGPRQPCSARRRAGSAHAADLFRARWARLPCKAILRARVRRRASKKYQPPLRRHPGLPHSSPRSSLKSATARRFELARRGPLSSIGLCRHKCQWRWRAYNKARWCRFVEIPLEGARAIRPQKGPNRASSWRRCILTRV